MISYSDAITLRGMIADRGGYPKQLTVHQLQSVAKRMGDDLDLTATALTMEPRPQWVCVLVGMKGLLEEAVG